MNEREVAELRRRFKADKNNISHVTGCYVNEKREIISQFHQPLSTMSLEAQEKLLTLLRKVLSGALGRNLLDIPFDTRQVVDSPEHRLLMSLRESTLREQAAVDAFFQQVIQSLELEGNYIILLAYDAYDVPYRSRDGEQREDQSDEVFRYIVCSICPMKQTKPALSYSAYENQFHNLAADWVIAPPQAGFLFPAFDDRSTNLYNALYYTRDSADTHPELIQALFQQEAPMAADEQMETFQSILGEALSEACSYHVVQTVNDQLRDRIAEHKLNKEEVPLTVSKGDVLRALESSGVGEEHTAQFGAQYDEAFGPDTDLRPANLVDTRQMEIKTPDVTIRVDPLKSELVETRTIDGIRYILIRAEDGVEVDGVPIHID